MPDREGQERPAARGGRVSALLAALLAAAALVCFLLPAEKVGFNLGEINAIQQSLPPGSKPLLPDRCGDGLLFTYSGTALLGGGDAVPNHDCLTELQSTADSSLGIQPLDVVAAVLLLAVLVAAVARRRGWRIVAIAGGAGAAALVLIENARFASVFSSKFGQGGSDLGIIDTSAASGTWVIIALALAAAVVAVLAPAIAAAGRAIAPLEEPRSA